MTGVKRHNIPGTSSAQASQYDQLLRSELHIGHNAKPGTLAGDHVVSLSELRQNPRFKALTLKQQLRILNSRANLHQLGADINSGIKGARSLEQLLRENNIQNPDLWRIANRAKHTIEILIRAAEKSNKRRGVNVVVENLKFLSGFRSRLAASVYGRYLSVLPHGFRLHLEKKLKLPKTNLGRWVGRRLARVGKVGSAIAGLAPLLTVLDAYKLEKGRADAIHTAKLMGPEYDAYHHPLEGWVVYKNPDVL